MRDEGVPPMVDGDDAASSGVREVLDERGRACPLPVIALAAAARRHPGGVIEVWADDPAVEHDIPAWCRMRGGTLMDVRDTDAVDRPVADHDAHEPASAGRRARRYTVRAPAG